MLQWHTLNFKSLGAVLPYHTLYQNYRLKHLIITAGFLPVPYVVLSRMASLWKQLTHAASSVTQPSWRTFQLSMRVIKVCDVCIVSLERNHSKRWLEGFQKHRSDSGLILWPFSPSDYAARFTALYRDTSVLQVMWQRSKSALGSTEYCRVICSVPRLMLSGRNQPRSIIPT